MGVIINKITKSYVKDNKKITVIENLSVKFQSGKFYAILGKSGAGKTTFLRCIALLCDLDDGSITINNKNLTKCNDEEISKIRNEEIGIIFQDYNLLPFFTAYENIALPLLVNNSLKKINNRKIDAILEYVGLEDRKVHYPNELSGGEQQRVAIARALINDPSLILADEPTGNIDKENKEKILNLLKKISKDNKCVIVVTHDDDVLDYADKIYYLDNGKLVDYENEN